MLAPLLELLFVLRSSWDEASPQIPDDLAAAIRSHVGTLRGSPTGQLLDSFPILTELLGRVLATWMDVPHADVTGRR